MVWHQLQLQRQQAEPLDVLVMGCLSRDWKWGVDFLPAVTN